MFEKLRKSTVQLARPRARKLHGIEINKQPVGAYFEMLEQTGEIIPELLDAAFPNKTPQQVLEELTTFSAVQLRELVVRLMRVLPRKLVAMLRIIVGAQDNPAWDRLTPAEMAEVCKVFWEVNDLSGFFENARSAAQHILNNRRMGDTGSSG